jgi:hypothetical protein
MQYCRQILGTDVRRHKFISLVGGTAGSGPLAVHAQLLARSSKVRLSILFDLERDPVASGLVSTLSRNRHER